MNPNWRPGAREPLRVPTALRRERVAEGLLLVLLTTVVAYAAGRGLHAGAIYDEGVYMASLDGLAHGQKLGSQVFASQPPGFYLLLEVERAIFGASLADIRTGMLTLALVGCLSAYVIGRSVAGRAGGFLAMALMAVPIATDDAAVRVRNDFPSVALSLAAIALAIGAVRRRGRSAQILAAVAGATLAAAISVKLLAFPTIVPVLAIVLGSRRRRLVLGLVAGAATVTVALVVAYASVLGALWSQAVSFHLDVRSKTIPGEPTGLSANARKVVSAVAGPSRLLSPFPWLVSVGAVGTILAWRRGRLHGTLPLWLWAATAAAFLVWHKPLWSHDVVILIVSLGVAAGVGIASLLHDRRVLRRAVGAASALAIAATLAAHTRRSSAPESAGVVWAAALVRTHTPAGTEVVSDWPIIPFLADRRVPGELVDTSRTRMGAGRLTRPEILRTIDTHDVSAVVLARTLLSDPVLERALEARFPVSIIRRGVRLPEPGGPVAIRVYLRRS